jgi:hypothetical protein
VEEEGSGNTSVKNNSDISTCQCDTNPWDVSARQEDEWKKEAWSHNALLQWRVSMMTDVIACYPAVTPQQSKPVHQLLCSTSKSMGKEYIMATQVICGHYTHQSFFFLLSYIQPITNILNKLLLRIVTSNGLRVRRPGFYFR